jgi:hypothetical protein
VPSFVVLIAGCPGPGVARPFDDDGVMMCF